LKRSDVLVASLGGSERGNLDLQDGAHLIQVVQ
jgi:hypothetical protein